MSAFSTVILTTSEELGQLPFEMVQESTLRPVESPLTTVLGSEALVKVAEPLITDHDPVPVTAMLPAKVVDVAQMV